MKFSKICCVISVSASLLVSGVANADTCYDPNYDTYYNCSGDEYIAPIAAALLFSAILSNENGYGGHRHGDYRNHGGGHDGYRGRH